MHHLKASNGWKKMNSSKMKYRPAGLKKMLIYRHKDGDGPPAWKARAI
jgi:hypothetical protein